MLCAWMPRTIWAATTEASTGSSPSHSNVRPAQGTRTKFTAGARAMLVPLPCCSAPMASPNAYAAAGSQVCAMVSAPGQAVTALTSSATPCGPSSRCSGGRPSRASPGTLPTYGMSNTLWPCTQAIFSASVMLATSAAACGTKLGPQGEPPAACRGSATSSSAAAAVERAMVGATRSALSTRQQRPNPGPGSQGAGPMARCGAPGPRIAYRPCLSTSRSNKQEELRTNPTGCASRKTGC